MRIRAAILLLLVVAPLPLEAATLVGLKLIPDGSLKPPGDRVELVLNLSPGEQKLRIEVRAKEVSAEKKLTAVRGRDERFCDDEKQFLITTTVERSKESRAINASLTIPYDQLELGNGTHQISYAITVLNDQQLVWSQATELSTVTVGQGVRRTMTPPPTTTTAPFTRQTTAFVPGAKTPDGAETFEKKTIEVSESRVIPGPATGRVAVEIAGRFDRELKRALPTPPGSTQKTETFLSNWPVERPWIALSDVRDPEERQVYFATNRAAPEVAVAGGPRFGTNVAEGLTYGVCTVNIPVEHHRKGNLEEPGWFERRDPQKHFMIELLTPQDREQFLEAVGPRDTLVFVHGFMNTFEGAVLRTAQLRYDLEFPGTAVAFCWPSMGDLNQYKLDSEHADKSFKALAEILRGLIASRPEAAGGTKPKLHLLAHSMGNRVLLGALGELFQSGELGADKKPFGQIILAAPDVGAARFNNLVGLVAQSCEQVTYYHCKHDAALRVSQNMNHYEPIGLFPYFDRALRTIDADGADTSFLGHNYYSSSREVLLDMQLALVLGLSPDERMPPLATRVALFGHDMWSFTPIKAAPLGKLEANKVSSDK